jgi:hypothetical protein
MELELGKDNEENFYFSALLGIQNLKVKNDYTNVLLCAQSKSGSLHINHLLAASLGYTNHQIGFNLGGGEVYWPRLLGAKFMGKNTVSHCHARLSHNIYENIQNLDFKLIVNTRNFLDSLLSRCERMKTKNPLNPLSGSGYDKYVEGDFEYKLDTAIELFANEYLMFFAGWSVYDKEVIRTTYEEMLADEVGLIHRIADELGVPVVGDVEEISREIKEAGGIGFNKGISGRGRKAFNDRQKAEIRRKADILGCDDEEFLDGI